MIGITKDDDPSITPIIDLKILYLSANGFPTSNKDPKGSFSLEHCKALRDEGAEIVAVDMQSKNFGSSLIDNIPIKRIPRLRGLLLGFKIDSILKYICSYRSLRKFKYDAVVFSFFYLKYIPFIWLLSKCGIPTVIIVHGGEVMPGSMFRQYAKIYMFKMVDLVLPVSDFTSTLLSCMVLRKNGDNRKIRTIYNGVDLTKLNAHRFSPCLRDIIHASVDDFLVLSIANLVKRKGIDNVMRAVEKLASSGYEIKHIIVGSGPEEQHLREIALASSCPSNFYFFQTLSPEQLVDFYLSSNIFVLLSHSDWSNMQTEGFGVVFAEAMYLGLPVITGRGSGTDTVVKDGFTGVLIDPESPTIVSDLAGEIVKFMNNPVYLAAMSEQAHKYTNSRFLWSINAKQTLSEISRTTENLRT